MTADPQPPAESPPAPERGEQRWPMAAAVLATGVLHQLLPSTFRIQPHAVYPVVLVGLLLVLIIGDPGRIDRRRPWLRVTTGLMIGLITVVNGFAAIRLVLNILFRSGFGSARELLGIGVIVWTINVIAFALWLWDLDAGGAAARAAGAKHPSPALVFPEMTLPEYTPPDWYPQFADYLSLSFNTATAFGPTDVAAVKRWAKMMMTAESAISLAVVVLVVSRAINLL